MTTWNLVLFDMERADPAGLPSLIGGVIVEAETFEEAATRALAHAQPVEPGARVNITGGPGPEAPTPWRDRLLSAAEVRRYNVEVLGLAPGSDAGRIAALVREVDRSRVRPMLGDEPRAAAPCECTQCAALRAAARYDVQ